MTYHTSLTPLPDNHTSVSSSYPHGHAQTRSTHLQLRIENLRLQLPQQGQQHLMCVLLQPVMPLLAPQLAVHITRV